MFQIQDYDDLFLYVYCFVDDELKRIGYKTKTRCELNVSEILTIQIVGEIMEKKTEKAIYELLPEHKRLFNAAISRPSFYKQLKWHFSALERIAISFGEKFGNDDEVCFVDGFPIPIKKVARSKQGVNLNGRAKRGCCASLKEYFYGLKEHLLVASNGVPRRLLFAPGNVHDSKLLLALIEDEKNKIIGCDKGCIGQKIAEIASQNGNTIVTQKKKNQPGYQEHNKAIRPFMKRRKIVETVIGHFERMHSKAMK